MKNILIILLGLLLATTVYTQTFPVTTILNSGPQGNRINMTYLGDGYTLAQQTAFLNDAVDINNELLDQTPFKEYAAFFNGYAIQVASAQSGVDHPGTATDVTEPGGHPVLNVNTYLNSTFDYFNIHRLLVPTNSTAINNVLNVNLPAYDQAIIICNTSFYGGSGGTYATTSINSSATEIAIHEIGHSFASLSDEYYAGDFYANEDYNMTQETNPALVKWDEWHGENGIGIYQHCCGGMSASWYRPHQDCKMRFLGSPFCSVCTQRIIDRIYELVEPVENISPANTSTINVGSTPQIFQAEFIYPSPNTLSVNWRLNGSVIASNVESVSLINTDLNAGANTLELVVIDGTELSRSYLPAPGYGFVKTWNLVQENDCPPNILHNSAITSGSYHASNILTSQIILPANGNVSYKAGNEVKLTIDFEVPQNTVFEAQIENCN